MCAQYIGPRSTRLSFLLIPKLGVDFAGQLALPGTDLLIEVPELAACVAQEKLALDPDGKAEEVDEEQSAVKRDALEVAVQDEIAPRHEEVQLVHRPEAEREKNQRGDKS